MKNKYRYLYSHKRENTFFTNIEHSQKLTITRESKAQKRSFNKHQVIISIQTIFSNHNTINLKSIKIALKIIDRYRKRYGYRNGI